jgi:negative regulator of flagellin synthesis FlgM
MSIKLDAPVGAPRLEQVASITRAGGDRSAPVAGADGVDSMRLTGDAIGLKQLEKGLDKGAFDARKVESLRAAIADGTYTVDPNRIARGMLELESELYR